MNTTEARLQLLRPAWPLMGYIEEQFQAVEDGRVTLARVLPWIRTANRRIENLVFSDDLHIAMLDRSEGEDRYRIKYFIS